MLEKRKFNTYKIKTSNPTYYCTSESWKKVYHACKDRKNISCMCVKIEKNLLCICVSIKKINQVFFSKEMEP